MLLVLPLRETTSLFSGDQYAGNLFNNSLRRGMGEPADATCPATLGDHEPPLPGEYSVVLVGASPGDLNIAGTYKWMFCWAWANLPRLMTAGDLNSFDGTNGKKTGVNKMVALGNNIPLYTIQYMYICLFLSFFLKMFMLR